MYNRSHDRPLGQRPRQGRPVRASAPRSSSTTLHSQTICLLALVGSRPSGGREGPGRLTSFNKEADMTNTAHDSNTCHTTPLPEKKIPGVQETHQLISRFLSDFLRLAEPDSAAQMVLETCTILPAAGHEGTNIIRAQVKSSRGVEVMVIVAIEPEALPTYQMAQK